jgi:hypothetical protein
VKLKLGGSRFEASPGKYFLRAPTLHPPNLQNNHSKMDWRCGSSDTTPALQVGIPEFKPQSHQKQTKTPFILAYMLE